MEKEYLTVPIEKVKMNDLNPRVHSSANLAMIKRSMNKVGVIDNIIVDENNVILAGHGRYLALKELGKKQIDVTKVTGLTEAQKKQYIVYSNRTTEVSEWNGELLVNLTDEIMKSDSTFNVGDFELEELTKCYSLDEIYGESQEKETKKDKELFIVGFCYSKQDKVIMDFIESLKTLSEANNDVEIFKGKRKLFEEGNL